MKDSQYERLVNEYGEVVLNKNFITVTSNYDRAIRDLSVFVGSLLAKKQKLTPITTSEDLAKKCHITTQLNGKAWIPRHKPCP